MTNSILFRVVMSGIFALFLFSLLTISGCRNDQAAVQKADITSTGVASIDALSNSIDKDPSNGQLYYQRGKIYYDSEVYADAIKDLILATEYDSLNADAWHLLADAFLDNNQSRQAIETLESFLELIPDRIPTRLKIAEFQLIIERHKAAHMHLDKIIQQQPDHAEALFMKGLVYRAEGLNIPAADHLQRAVQSDPDLVDGYLLLGELFEQAKNPLALKYYQNALRLQPGHLEAQLAIANYYWTNDNPLESLEILDGLIKQSPFFTKALFNKGLIYLELDSLEKAYDALLMASKSDPSYMKAHYYLGHAKERMGDIESAKSHYLNAQNLSPSDKEVAQSLSRLEE